MVVVIEQSRCCHCGGCVAVCPCGALLLDGHSLRADIARCSGCGLCVNICPAGALRLGYSLKEEQR